MPPIDSSFSSPPAHHTKHDSSGPPVSLPPLHLQMVPELEKPRVTEIQVRMDCNGCVQKIKKALHGINGIYDIYIDVPQQKITIIGWADPERIVKAIRHTKRIATICSHTEPPDPAAQPAEQPQQAPEGGGPPPASEASQPPPPSPQPPQAEPAPQGEPPKDQQPPPPSNETPPPPPPQERPSPSQVAVEAGASQPAGPKDVGEVHVIHHHPPSYAYRYGPGQSYEGHWNRYQNTPVFPPEPPQPAYVTQSYNTYRPSPYVTGYEHASTPYEYVRPPPQHVFYGRTDRYNDDYHDNNRNGNITSIFSDENPNACTIA